MNIDRAQPTKTVLHIDMNAFFASVEQLTNPFIRNKPVGVGSGGYDNAALLAISYEAKALGVPKFARLREARRICPSLIAVPFDPLKYYSVNRQLVSIFREMCPKVEVYSIDEAFMDITGVIEKYNNDPVEFAKVLKQRILDEVGVTLTTSVGIANNKLLAKIASNWVKPNGLTVIKWEERFNYLDKLPFEKIWGIGPRSAAKLNKLGINSTKDLRKIPPHTLREMVGTYYTRLVSMAWGEYLDDVDTERVSKPHKSMQHAHTLSKPTKDTEELLSYIRKMSERLAKRLRKHKQFTTMVQLGLKPEKLGHYGWGSATPYSGFKPLEQPTASGTQIYEAAKEILLEMGELEQRIRLLYVEVGDLSQSNQLILNFQADLKRESLEKAKDEIDAQFGNFTVRTADILYNKAKESELTIEKEDMVFHPD